MNNDSTPQRYASDVRDQYEDFPYPMRDPAREGEQFHGADIHSLPALAHAGWGGRRDLRRGTRILIAGCGTGDSTLMFAEESLGHDVEIVAVDLSAASIAIAKERLARRGLGGVQFHHRSILDLPEAGLGTFDIVESSGVLHHLPDPAAGLAALAALLKEDGLIAGMVYAQYGRMSIYLVQELMRRLIPDGTPRQEKIHIAREFLNCVPQGHWLTVNNSLFLEDMRWPDGSGIYDLFLHSTDRAYTVPQLYDWIEGAGLQLTDLHGDMADGSLYDPASYSASPVLLQQVEGQTLRQRQEVAELMNGNIGKHYFYAAKQPKAEAILADDMVIEYGPMQSLFYEFIPPLVQALTNASLGMRVEGPVRPFAQAPNLVLAATPHAAALLAGIDGRRSVADLLALPTVCDGEPAQVRLELETLYRAMRSRQMVYLRQASIAPYTSGLGIIARMNAHLKKTS